MLTYVKLKLTIDVKLSRHVKCLLSLKVAVNHGHATYPKVDRRKRAPHKGSPQLGRSVTIYECLSPSSAASLNRF